MKTARAVEMNTHLKMQINNRGRSLLGFRCQLERHACGHPVTPRHASGALKRHNNTNNVGVWSVEIRGREQRDVVLVCDACVRRASVSVWYNSVDIRKGSSKALARPTTGTLLSKHSAIRLIHKSQVTSHKSQEAENSDLCRSDWALGFRTSEC
jgi:hypothetical protein